MEENDIKEDQVGPVVQEFATYCLRHNMHFDKLIQSRREALYLEEKFGIAVEKITDYIMVQSKQ
jgi:hypothetical protein